jgi:hypothetical protein
MISGPTTHARQPNRLLAGRAGDEFDGEQIRH